jgi:Secretion system C-terminal sorting domain/Pregnancy-associated plasma protein-A
MKISSPLSIQLSILFFGIVTLGSTYSQGKKPTDKTLFGKSVTTKNNNPNNGIIRCATVEYEQFLKEKNPKRATEDQFENWLAPLVKKQIASRTNAKTAAPVITIPVVVHIIHSGQAIGTAPNISDAQVESQIAVLNQDYRKQTGTPGGTSTNPDAADVEIEFVLAKVDPNGNPTNGIDRINFAQPSWENTGIESTVKPATIWDPNLYLNMWTIKFSDNTLLGYAQFPNASTLPGLNTINGTANTDGVVASFDVFGSNDFGTGFILAAPYNKGRTMSHEVGHFLGLRHIWGDGNGNEDTNTPDCTATDYCADTPQVGWEHYSCGTYDTCTSSPGNDMPENYMDYTNDTCMNIFTLDQKTRMTTVMANSPRRLSLKTSNTGTVIPLFANDAELKIETDYSLVNVSDCASLPAPTNKKITLANRGTTTLTSATINYSIAGGPNQVQAWTGSLAPNQTTMVTLVNTASYGILTASIGTTNSTTDQRTSNNSDTETFSPVNYTFTNYVFNLQQDFYGGEIDWDIKDKDGNIIYKGGPYTDKGNEVLPLPTLITQNWTLANNQCYTFTIRDSQGDGICCFGGNGFYNIKSVDGLTTIASGASYEFVENRHFTTNTLVNATFDGANDIYLYPNPTKDYINVNIPSEYGLPNSLTINNSLGQIISQKEVATASDLSLNTSSLSNGVYFITITKDTQTKTLQFIKE